MESKPRDGGVVILSGAGLSAASGVPTFRDANGLWEGHRVEEVATPEAWFANRTLVRRFYDERRVRGAEVHPNPGHQALVRLQQAWGPKRVALVTQNVDGLIQQAGSCEVIEMHGSLWRLQCEADHSHPQVQVTGRQDAEQRCVQCAALLRPAVVWFGEMPEHMDRIYRALEGCQTFVSVGTSGLVYPAAGFAQVARAAGALCIEVNPKPAGGPFHEVIAQGSEEALPSLVDSWLEQRR